MRSGRARTHTGVEDVETEHFDRPRRALHLEASACELVQTPAADLDGRDHGRHLLEPARERGRRHANLVCGHVTHVGARRHLSGGIQGARGNAENNLAHVGLAEHGGETQQAGGAPHPDDEDAGGIRVERAGVADAPGRRGAGGCGRRRRGRSTRPVCRRRGSRRGRRPSQYRSVLPSSDARPHGVVAARRCVGARPPRGPRRHAGVGQELQVGVRFMRTERPITRCRRCAVLFEGVGSLASGRTRTRRRAGRSRSVLTPVAVSGPRRLVVVHGSARGVPDDLRQQGVRSCDPSGSGACRRPSPAPPRGPSSGHQVLGTSRSS